MVGGKCRTRLVNSSGQFPCHLDDLSPEWEKREFISALLSKNEIGSTNPYFRKLFRRRRTGRYILYANLAIRQEEEWIAIYHNANVKLIADRGLESGDYLQTIIRSLISDEED